SSGRGARKQQIRDVGGGNQEKATDCAPGDKKIQTKAAGDQLLLQQRGVNGDVEIVVAGIVAPIACVEYGERGLGLVNTDPLLEAADDGEVSSAAANGGGEKCSGVGHARSPNLDRFTQELEARGNHPNDRMGNAIDTQAAGDNVGIGIKVAFPIAVAKNDQRRSGSAILVGSKRPAEDWLNPQHGKEIRGYAAALEACRHGGD